MSVFAVFILESIPTPRLVFFFVFHPFPCTFHSFPSLSLSAVRCGHCKRLRPIWDELSEWAASSSDDNVGIAKVDATKNRDLADRFGVRGYPTLIYIHGSSYQKYTGGRTLEDLQSFLDGGYRDGTTTPLPSPPGLSETIQGVERRLKKEYLMLEEDFIHIMAVRKNAMTAFLIIGGLVGCVLGCILGSVCCRCRGGGRKTKTD